MVEAVGSFGSRGVGVAGMSSSTLEEVQMQETLLFSDTIKVTSSLSSRFAFLHFFLSNNCTSCFLSA
jgi:hypothetical protein